jgi:GrpB-like predicted nucleotidyltransferase (UPF0157 family)
MRKGIMALGLSDGTVSVVDHDGSWAAAYEVERAVIRSSLSEFDCLIEHVGSTAVPGLAAKPIIDIAVGAVAGSEPDCVDRLQGAGFEYRGYTPEGGHVLIRRADGLRTHHVHVVPADGEEWAKYLAFRDLLRRDPEARDAYAAVKKELALRFSRDRRGYLAGKDEIVAQLLARAEVDGVSA